MYNSNSFPQIKFSENNNKSNSNIKPFLGLGIFLSGLVLFNYSNSKPVEIKENSDSFEIQLYEEKIIPVKPIVKKNENISNLLEQNKILETRLANYEKRFTNLEKRISNNEGIIGVPINGAITNLDVNFDGISEKIIPYSGGSVRAYFSNNNGKITSSALSPDVFSKVFLSYMFTQEELDKIGYGEIKDRILNKNVRKIIRKNPSLACEWIKLGYATGNLTMNKKYLKRPFERLKGYHRKAGRNC